MLVLLVDVEGDRHTLSIAAALDRMGVANLRISIEDVGQRRFTVTQAGLMWDGTLVPAGSTIFWRDPGRYAAPSDMSEPEVQMLTSEVAALFTGALFAGGPRWIHHPHQAMTAANKVFQLTTAKELGVSTPDWLVTNSAADA